MSVRPRIIEAARAVALASEGTGRSRNFRVGAVIFSGKKILSAGFNSYKTHPKVLKHCPWPYLHAEAAAVLHLGLDNCENRSIISLRLRRDDTLSMARPCPACENLLREVGISKIYYSDWNGNIESCLGLRNRRSGES